jgi:hypothetical protein
MPKLRIAQKHSHLFAEDIVRQRFPGVAKDIEGLDGLSISGPTPSKERTKAGKDVYRGANFNLPIEKYLRDRGWTERKAPFRGVVDFAKDRVAIEVQFGKYAFVAHDLNKFLDLFTSGGENGIDVGIEIVPSEGLARRMYTGVANFSVEVASIQARGRTLPPMPIWFVGVDVEDD